jgi:hypothetical protein
VCFLALVQVRLLDYLQRGLVLLAVDSSRKPFDKNVVDNLVFAEAVVQEAVVDFMSHCMRASIWYSACWGMCLAAVMCLSLSGIPRRGSRLTFAGASYVDGTMDISMLRSWYS